MAGSGPLLLPMKRLSQDLNIEEEIIFHGTVKEVDLIYAKAGIYVLPSVLEGFPNSLCEAMAAGLPVICFDSIHPDDILTNGEDGLVVPEGDIPALAKTIEGLMNNERERKRLGQNASKIREKLSVEVVGKQVLDFMFSEN